MKAFSLLITIVLLILFSYLIPHTLFTQNLHLSHQKTVYTYIQAQFHLQFFKTLISNLTPNECQTHWVLEHPHFDISASLTYANPTSDCKNTQALVDIFVTPKNGDLSIHLHERFIKKFD